MRILYYSTAYHAGHGGSLHSKAFVKWARLSPLVDAIDVFPDTISVSKAKKFERLRAVFRSISLFQIFFFKRRQKLNLKSLLLKVSELEPDLLHIRLDSNFYQIRYLQEIYPNLIITTEVNASPFDESFSNIAFKRFWRRKERLALQRANRNFFVSARLRELVMRDFISFDRDIVVQNGVEDFFFVNEVELREGKLLKLAYVGTLDLHKRIRNLVEAVLNLNDKGIECELVIIGDGQAKSEIESMVRLSSNGNCIKMLGWKAHHEIPRIFDQVDIAIHHYAKDYMSPLKVFEYMAMGKPVLGPKTSSVQEIFIDYEHILLTNGQIGDIENKLRELISKPQLRFKIAKNGCDLAKSKYTWKVNVDTIISSMLECTVLKGE